jgi:hypothetical protein
MPIDLEIETRETNRFQNQFNEDSRIEDRKILACPMMVGPTEARRDMMSGTGSG